MTGGTETDTVTFEDSTSGVTARLNNNRAIGQGTDTLIGFENLTGSEHADVLRGDGGPNAIDGLERRRRDRRIRR